MKSSELIINKLKDAFDSDLSDSKSIPFWSWNNILDEDALVKQIDEMKKTGIGGFIIHARTGLRTPYLGRKWFSCVEACLKKAKKENMHAWIYDENGWPSGFIGGKLLKNEAYRARFLEYSLNDFFDNNAFVVYKNTLDGYKRIYKNEPGLKEYHTVYLRVSPANTDILNPEVVDAFIEGTHNRYYKRFKDSFGKELVGFFTDEPQYYRWATPYPIKVKEEFDKKYNQDVLDGLIYLFKHDKRGYQFRVRYYSTLNEMYVNNYYKKLYDWCNKHNCLLTGHSVEEPHLYSQMWGGAGVMTSYEYEHIPGIDSLTRKGEYFLSSKQVGSVSSQLGKKQVLTETFGCSGYDVTPYELKHIAELQYFNGVNLMCEHLMPYSLSGQAKHDCPPIFYKQNNWWEESKEFNSHFNRLGHLIQNTKELVDCLIIHPMKSVYLDYIRDEDYKSVKELEDSFSRFLELLNRNGITYHLADETILKKYGKVKNDILSVGKCDYKILVVPKMSTISRSTLDLINEYKGKIYVESNPQYIDGVLCDVDIKSNISFEDLKSLRMFDFSVKKGDGILTVREGELGKFIFIKNQSLYDEMECRIDTKEEIYSILDIDTLSLSSFNEDMLLGPKEGLILIKTEEKIENKYTNLNVIESPFKLTGITDNYLISDKAGLSFDGINYKEMPLPQIFENLLYNGYKGKIFIKHKFIIKDLIPLKLMIEKYNYLSTKFNGKEIVFKQSDFDINFVESDITDLIKIGINEYVYSLNYYQREEVRFAFFDPLATESLRNCLYYDTYIENVYLKGKFIVNKDGSISKMEELPKKGYNIQLEGYPFFYGNITLNTNYNYDGRSKVELEPIGRFLVLNISVNNKSKNLVLDKKIDITDLLSIGDNNIVIVAKSSLRNLLGPHHSLNFKEGDWVVVDKFNQYRTWKDGVSPEYDNEYNLVPFGIERLIIHEYK